MEHTTRAIYEDAAGRVCLVDYEARMIVSGLEHADSGSGPDLLQHGRLELMDSVKPLREDRAAIERRPGPVLRPGRRRRRWARRRAVPVSSRSTRNLTLIDALHRGAPGPGPRGPWRPDVDPETLRRIRREAGLSRPALAAFLYLEDASGGSIYQWETHAGGLVRGPRSHNQCSQHNFILAFARHLPEVDPPRPPAAPCCSLRTGR